MQDFLPDFLLAEKLPQCLLDFGINVQFVVYGERPPHQCFLSHLFVAGKCIDVGQEDEFSDVEYIDESEREGTDNELCVVGVDGRREYKFLIELCCRFVPLRCPTELQEKLFGLLCMCLIFLL